MPATTARYRFEFALLEWAERWSVGLCGHRCAFFLELRADASMRRVWFAGPAEPFDATRKAQLTAGHPRWFLYLPYDALGSAYLEWNGLPARLVERWLARRLDPTDFLDVRTTGARAEWPESWRVVVA